MTAKKPASCDFSEDVEPAVAETKESAAEERRAAECQAFADKLAGAPMPKPSRRNSR